MCEISGVKNEGWRKGIGEGKMTWVSYLVVNIVKIQKYTEINKEIKTSGRLNKNGCIDLSVWMLGH